jgi:diguanylate cyclase (GGDEF)-like protein
MADSMKSSAAAPAGDEAAARSRESGRLGVLDSTRLLDSPPEAAFDRLTRLAGGLLGASGALVSLVDRGRQFFKSAWGLEELWASRRETPLTHSFCQHVVHDRQPLIVEDAREHPILKHNLAVPELGVIAYAGMPLIIEGEAIGAFCVVDRKARPWSEQQIGILADLRDSIVSEIELRIALRAAEAQRALTATLVESMGDIVLAIDRKRKFLIVNQAARQIFGRAEVGQGLPGDWTAVHRSRRLDGSPLPSEDGALIRGLRGKATDGLTFTLQAPGARETVWLEATGRPVRDAQGNLVAAIAVYRDVTARTRQADRYRALVGNVPRGLVALFDDGLRCLAVDGVLIREITDNPAQLIGESMQALATASGVTQFDAIDAMCRRTLAGESVNQDVVAGERTIALHTTPVRDELGRVSAGLVLALDCTAERQVEAALRRSEQVHRAIVKNLPNGAVLMLDRELRYVAADGPIIGDVLRAANLTELVGRRYVDIAAPDTRDMILEVYHGGLRGEVRHLEIKRGTRAFDMRTVPLYDGDQVTNILVFLYDITERKREEEELRKVRDQLVAERALFEATLANIDDGVALLDANHRLLLANTSFASMFGLAKATLDDMAPEQFNAHVSNLLEDPASSLERFQRDQPEACDEFVFARPSRRVLRRSWGQVRLPTQECYLVTWHDITSDKALLAERDQLLLVDTLTGIPNRRAAESALKVELSRMRRTGLPFCVAMVDIDHFKRVNDTFGHAAGDIVLGQVASTILGEARITDTIARWGGEEFLAILQGSLDGAQVFCERTRKAIERLSFPGIGSVTVSIGLAEIEPNEEPPATIARADERLYDAKRGGRNRVEL